MEDFFFMRAQIESRAVRCSRCQRTVKAEEDVLAIGIVEAGQTPEIYCYECHDIAVRVRRMVLSETQEGN